VLVEGVQATTLPYPCIPSTHNLSPSNPQKKKTQTPSEDLQEPTPQGTWGQFSRKAVQASDSVFSRGGGRVLRETLAAHRCRASGVMKVRTPSRVVRHRGARTARLEHVFSLCFHSASLSRRNKLDCDVVQQALKISFGPTPAHRRPLLLPRHPVDQCTRRRLHPIARYLRRRGGTAGIGLLLTEQEAPRGAPRHVLGALPTSLCLFGGDIKSKRTGCDAHAGIYIWRSKIECEYFMRSVSRPKGRAPSPSTRRSVRLRPHAERWNHWNDVHADGLGGAASAIPSAGSCDNVVYPLLACAQQS